MAHIDVHRIDQAAALRHARVAQIAALEPFPERNPLNAWEFPLGRYAHSFPVAVGGRLGRLYMGEAPEPVEQPDGSFITSENAGAPPRSERSPTVGRLPRGVPEQLSYSLINRITNILPNFGLVSTPPLPWPCQIVGASLHLFNQGTLEAGAWGVLVTSADYTGLDAMADGTPLIELIEDDPPQGAGFLTQQSRVTPVPFKAGGNAARAEASLPCTQLIGAIIRESGKRLTFAVTHNVDAGAEATLVVTVRQLVETAAPAVFRERVAPVPRAASPRATTARALPRQFRAPPAPPPVFGGLVVRGTRITPLFGAEAQTFVTGTPSQAVSLQNILSGQAAVTTPFRIGPGDTAIAAGQIGFESFRQIEARKALERSRAL